MSNIRTYFSERFPLAITSVHSLATASFLVGISSNTQNWQVMLCIAVGFFFFMLRMRVTDEFKDSSHDNSNYPDRPVQRGIISRNQLISIGIISLLLEITSAVLAGMFSNNLAAAWFYLAILGYSALTRFEFFAPKFLDRHFNIYFLSHQAIFLLYPLWSFNLFQTEISLINLGQATSFVLFMASMEIMRKYEIRRNPSGEIVLDTYLAVWKTWAFWIMLGITALGSALLYLPAQQPIFVIIGLLSCLLMILIRKQNEAVRLVVAITFLVLSGLCFWL
ncbi:MAG: UbiA family prenyltransferase [Rhodoluna sp.]|jgi:hypothetical protein